MKKLTASEFSQIILSSGQDSKAYPPDLDDLYFLYSFARDKSIVSVLEIGSGWSTLALAMAVIENKESFGDAYLSRVRHPNPFQVDSIDASAIWSKIALKRLSREQRGIVVPHVSGLQISEWRGPGGPICSLFENFPIVSADLIYLDGPDSDQVEGNIRGVEFRQPDSLPMAADLLPLEAQMWPGTFIISDGRLANVRFLKNNFNRNWEALTDFYGDRTILHLEETPLGPVNREHLAMRLEASRNLLDKRRPLGTDHGNPGSMR